MSNFTVSGGTAGVGANLADLKTSAELTLALGAELVPIAFRCHGLLMSVDLVASMPLDPIGFARIEAALIEALDGPSGLSFTAAQLTAESAHLLTVLASYAAWDQSMKGLALAAQFAGGAVLATAVKGGVGGVWVSPVIIASTSGLTAASIAALLSTDEGRQHLLDLLKRGVIDVDQILAFLVRHPGIVDMLVNAAPGFLTAIGLVSFTPADGAAWLGLIYKDGSGASPHVKKVGDSTASSPPKGVKDLLTGLEQTGRGYNSNNHDATKDQQGKIRVTKVVGQDGKTSWIVDIPGTQDWRMNPGDDATYLNDFATNVHAMAGQSTMYEQAIKAALESAGVSATDPVMLVGHSQGGIVAMNAAAHSATSAFPYNVTHVVTAGSPVAGIHPPPNVQVLSIENKYDLVPHLDGSSNPSSPNWTTVTFENQHHSVGGNHSLTGDNNSGNYIQFADQIDTSSDPSVNAFMNSANGFFNGVSATSEMYQATR